MRSTGGGWLGATTAALVARIQRDPLRVSDFVLLYVIAVVFIVALVAACFLAVAWLVS